MPRNAAAHGSYITSPVMGDCITGWDFLIKYALLIFSNTVAGVNVKVI